MRLLRVVVLVLVALAAPAAGHEVRPAYLEITETTPTRIDVLWKQPSSGQMAVRLTPRLSGDLLDARPRTIESAPNFQIKRWRQLDIGTAGLAGRVVAIDGLERTITDVLLVIRFHNGRQVQTLLKPATPRHVIGTAGSGVPVATYLRLGVEHILAGVDHLIFVFGLMLLVAGWAALLKTITAFTIAHSITLAATAVGAVTVNPALIEALVAMSIVFLALELVHKHRGERGLAVRYPWLIAFVFGLLHGTAFAGALNDIGLPADNIPLALFLFNVGVEIGQLVFVGGVVAIAAIGRRLLARVPAAHPFGARAVLLPAYAIGGFASFWFLDRLHLVFA